MLCKWENKTWITIHLFTIWFREYYKTTVQTYFSEIKRFLSKYYHSLVIWELWWTCTIRLISFSWPLIHHTFCSPYTSRSNVNLSYYLRNTFCKALATIIVIILMIWAKSIENLLKRIYYLNVINNICDSWKEVKISIYIGIWKKLTSILADDLEGSRL